jgi:peptidoglycan/xylan/chitin deacetylase (PgdA/CDA1 family)
MSMYFNNFNWAFQLLYPSLVWKKKVTAKELFLTFDDGPVPNATEFVLEELDKWNVKATFFCVGDNVRKYPNLLKEIIQRGHAAGNHTFNHLNGWKNADNYYLENVELCQAVIEEVRREAGLQQSPAKQLFRPPYGKIRRSQVKELQKSYEIIMWNVLTGDYDQKLKEEACLAKAINYSTPGSIVIFHDSIKASKNMKYVLPRYLEYFLSKGFEFKTL